MDLTPVGRSVTASLVRRAITACQPEGATWAYYRSEGAALAQLRRDVSAFVQGALRDDARTTAPGANILRAVSAQYRTRFKLADIPALSDALREQIHHHRSFFASPPDLLQSSHGATGTIARTYMDVLTRCVRATSRRPFSLVSKYLHLAAPATFVVYDRNAAASVLAWSQSAFPPSSVPESVSLHYDADNRYWVRHWDNPGWYAGLLDFYRHCWDAAEEAGLHEDLTRASGAMTEFLPHDGDQFPSPITSLDVIDQLLWQAMGDRRKLGLEV